jgi:hypothetical protein
MKRTPVWVAVAAVGVQFAALAVCVWATDSARRAPKALKPPPDPLPATPEPSPAVAAAEVIVAEAPAVPAPVEIPPVPPAAETMPSAPLAAEPVEVAMDAEPAIEVPAAAEFRLPPFEAWTRAAEAAPAAVVEPQTAAAPIEAAEPEPMPTAAVEAEREPAFAVTVEPAAEPAIAPAAAPLPEAAPEIPRFISNFAESTTQIVAGLADGKPVFFGIYADGNIRFVDVDNGCYAGRAEGQRARMREVFGSRAFTVQLEPGDEGTFAASFVGGFHEGERLDLVPLVGTHAA